MAAVKIYKVKSASLTETIVAMVVILVITSITIIVFVQATSFYTITRRINAQALLDKYILFTTSNRLFQDEEVVEDSYVIEKKILEVKGLSPRAVKMEFSVANRNGTVLLKQEIYLLRDE